MKKILPIIIAMVVSLAGCSKSNPLNGNWVTTDLIKDGIHQTITLSYINFEVKGSKATANGSAGVNLFHGTVDIAKNTFIASENFAITKMMGDPQADEFEMLFMETIMYADNYEITEDETLVIKCPAKNMELRLKKMDLDDVL